MRCVQNSLQGYFDEKAIEQNRIKKSFSKRYKMRIDLYTKFLLRVFDDDLGVAVTDVKGKSALSLKKKRKGKRKKLIRKVRKFKCLEDDEEEMITEDDVMEEDDDVQMKEKEQDQMKGYFRSEKEDEDDVCGDDVSHDDCDDESEEDTKCNKRRRFMHSSNTGK